MSLFLELISVDKMKEKARNAGKIAIIGCGGCMNSSLAAQSETGVTFEIDESSGESIARAVSDKVLELQYILSREGKKVTGHVISHDFTCFASPTSLKSLGTNVDILACDTIISLSCPAGSLGLREAFPRHQIITVAKIRGILYAPVEWINNNRVKRIVLEKVKIIPLPRERNSQ